MVNKALNNLNLAKCSFIKEQKHGDDTFDENKPAGHYKLNLKQGQVNAARHVTHRTSNPLFM